MKKQLLQKHKAIAVGEGFKKVKNRKTKKKGLVFFVKKKKKTTLEKLLMKALGQFIPPTIDGKETDVVELKEIEEQVDEYREKCRPIKSGVSMCNVMSTACTSGIPVYRNGWKALVNRHCAEDIVGQIEVGMDIIQPSAFDGGEDIVGKVETWYPKQETMEMDSALIDLHTEMIPETITKKYKKEIIDVEVGDKVWKDGRTTGHTKGEVLAVDVTCQVNSRDKVLTYEGQIFTTAMSKGGDSSSVGFKDDKIFGQLFAGSSEVSVFTPMQTVKDYFGFELDDKQNYYCSLGEKWYVEPQIGETKTTVRLNLRTAPRVSPETYIETMPVGTKLNILEYVGRKGSYEWCKIEKP